MAKEAAPVSEQGARALGRLTLWRSQMHQSPAGTSRYQLTLRCLQTKKKCSLPCISRMGLDGLIYVSQGPLWPLLPFVPVWFRVLVSGHLSFSSSVAQHIVAPPCPVLYSKSRYQLDQRLPLSTRHDSIAPPYLCFGLMILGSVWRRCLWRLLFRCSPPFVSHLGVQ